MGFIACICILHLNYLAASPESDTPISGNPYVTSLPENSRLGHDRRGKRKRGAMSVPWSSLFLLLAGAVLCAANLKTYDWQSDITCSQALNHCTVVDKNCVILPCAGALPRCTSTPPEVSSRSLEPALCSKTTTEYEACLLIRIRLRVPADEDVSGETPVDSEDEDCAALTLCYSFGHNLPLCKEITFSLKSSALRNREEPEVTVVVQDRAFLGSSVNVTMNDESQEVCFPNVNEVCPSPHLKECETPSLYEVIDLHKGVLELKAKHEELLLLCVKKNRTSHCWPSERILPLHTVTHCMCFQAWWKNREHESSYRSEICPYEGHKEFRRNTMKNVSLSVEHFETNEGLPALKWNLSAPCMLEAEVWLCQMAVQIGGDCRELPMSRKNIRTWKDENISTAWTSGEFLDVNPTNNLRSCVMFKVGGEMFGPVCKHYTPRVRWICLPIVTMLFVVLFAVGVCVLKVRHKEWLLNSNPAHQSQGLLGEVLLVHSSASDPTFSNNVCWLASWLSELGFAVSLDLWNQADVGNLGPTPWLHSRLQHIKRHGGKTLLLLSHEAVRRAKTHSESWSRALNDDASRTSKTSCLWNADVFSSALSALFSARLQGGAAEHFALVQLEPKLFELPELFHGLNLYQLPSDSQQLLTDLHTVQPGSLGARLKRFLWTWRASSRLEKKLRNCGSERRPRTESMLTHVESLSIDKDTEDEEETQPLKD